MLSKRVLTSMFISLCLVLHANIQAKWNLLIYAEPNQNLTEAIFKQINELVESYTSEEVQIYIQIRIFLDNKRSYAWRYTVKNNSLILQDSVKVTNNYVVDITNAAQWAFENSADYYGIIVTGHGYGILEPTYNLETQDWSYEPDSSSCYSCSKRSILLDYFNQRYMTNYDLINALEKISSPINKKIDLLGFDLCMGSSIEHAYQIAPYVSYMVGCQNCALIDGFNFSALGNHIQNPLCTPRSLALNIVDSFQEYYEKGFSEELYTLSAIDCSHASELTISLNQVTKLIITVLAEYPAYIPLIKDLRTHCFHACFVPMYTDLYEILIGFKTIFSDTQFLSLQQAIDKCLQNLQSIVIHNVTGKNISYVHGLSIYFPYNHIDSSYYNNIFAQQSNWIKFLAIITKNSSL